MTTSSPERTPASSGSRPLMELDACTIRFSGRRQLSPTIQLSDSWRTKLRMITAAATPLGVMLALTGSATALEQCETYCSRYEQGQCVEHAQRCTYTPPAPLFGAIAYGRKSEAWGDSYSWGSREEAEKVALQICAQKGDDCEILVWFDRQCGAVATGENGAPFWGLGDGIGAARGSALAKCSESGSKNCDVKASTCSR